MEVIEKDAFENCKKLIRIVLPENVKRLPESAMIGEQAFSGCGKLCEIKISDRVTKLGECCFEKCISLKGFDFHGIKFIGERAFSRCEGLEEIVLLMLCVRRRSFEDCCFLKRVSLISDTELKSGVFFGCTNIEEIVLDGVSYSFKMFSQSVRSFENSLP